MKAIGTVYLPAAIIPFAYWKKERIGLVITYWLLDGRIITRVLSDVYNR